MNNIWTRKEREEFRLKANLPILKSQKDFITRLRRDKVLIVIAETGSGKTTQLPQYMAEEFENENGIIVVTQPRALAAISVAERVGYEFDGPKMNGTSYSVGYKVGRDSKLNSNNRIVFMTDAQLIKEMLTDNLLSKVRGLLIDEAHERSINTDIVLGIAKYLLARRTDNFYIVVASATIDPKQFLNFFDKTNQELKVPGRIFRVDLEYWPDLEDKNYKEDDDDEDDDISVKSITKQASISSKFVVDKVFEAVERFKEGHTLVFVPGQKEVEECVQKFSEIAPSNFEVLPLFGSLSPDEQMQVIEFENKGKTKDKDRLVAFCTNIAETSLTVEGVKIVIDSGLSKESRYDMNRRANVLEMTWISKSSADQRKGRAGRTSPGTCIRLFSQDALTRESIEPEILRSSIDHVILQLKVLRLDNLPLIASPENDKWKLALENLRVVGALDEKSEVTNLGRLFSDLPFDPTISAFLTDLYMNHKTNIGIKTAALVTAPGNFFYLGNKETRKDDEKKITLKASNYDSDIIFKISVYDEWVESGNVDSLQKIMNGTYICRNCSNILMYPKCTDCQIKYTNDNKLNNRVLKYIHSTIKEVENILDKFKGFSDAKYFFLSHDCIPHGKNEKVEQCLSKGLSNWMQDQAVQTIVPSMPAIGLRIVSHNEKCFGNSTSSIINKITRKGESEFFIAVSPFFRIKKPPKKDIILASNFHPVELNYLVKSRNKHKQTYFDFQLALSEENVGPYLTKFKIGNENLLNNRDWLAEFMNEDDSRFCSSIYDKKNSKILIYCPSKLCSKVKQIGFEKIKNARNELMESEDIKPFKVSNNSFFAFFKNGFSCTRIVSNSDDIKLIVSNLSYQDYTDFNTKFFETYKFLDQKNLIDHDYNNKAKEVVLVFKDATSAAEYKTRFEEEKMNCRGFVSGSRTINHDHTVLCESRSANVDPTVENLKKIFKLEIKSVEICSANYTIIINRLPNDFCLPDWIPPPTTYNLKCDDKNKRGSASLFLNYSRFETANESHNMLIKNKSMLSNETEPKIGDMKAYAKWKTEFEDIESAEKIFQTRKEFTPEITITTSSYDSFKFFGNYFSKTDLNEILQEMCKSCEGSIYDIDKIDNEKNLVKVITSNLSPKMTVELKKKLKSIFEPIIIKMPPKNDSIRRFYFTKLFETVEFLETWPQEFNVSVQMEEEKWKGAKIYGSQIDLGKFMYRIGEDYDEFLERYKEINLEPEVAILFENNRIGAARLDELIKEYKTEEITYVDKSIRIYTKEKSRTNEVQYKVNKIINDILGTLGDKNRKKNKCVFCNENASLIKLLICGHYTCKECLKTLSKYTKIFPLSCKACKSPLHIKDFNTDFIVKAEFKILIKNAVDFYLKKDKKRFCPLNCEGLINEDDGYSKCSTCKKNVCGKCESVNPLHQNKSCEGFKTFIKKLRVQFEDIKNGAECWLKENWSTKLSAIVDTKVNPHLDNLDSKIWKIFQSGFYKLGIAEILQNSFYTFHGCPEAAVNSICMNGFDPDRRSGQVYGAGEYFGVSADISHPYCRGGNFMLIALILNGPHVTTKQNFCHVVANPKDKSLTYCLPLVIVNFGIKKTISYDVDEQLLHRYICYHWEIGKEGFEPYGQSENEKIERQFMKYVQSGKKENKTVSMEILRYNDDKLQSYLINFDKMIQKNFATGFERRITRSVIDLPNSQGNTWTYDDSGIWRRFDILWEGELELKFQNYLKGDQHHRFLITQAPRPETYEINFMEMTEKNTVTRTVRQIQRN